MSDIFAERFAGEPIKSVTITSKAGTTQGEFVITRGGVEGSLVYAHSAALRDELEQNGQVNLVLDLSPGRTIERLEYDLSRQDKKLSISNILRKAAGLTGVKAALVLEFQREKTLLYSHRPSNLSQFHLSVLDRLKKQFLRQEA